MMVHSGYYFSRQDILSLLVRKNLSVISVVSHQFGDATAELYEGEAVYRRNRDQTITMTARGNGFSYHHPNHDWYNLGYFQGEVDGVQQAMSFGVRWSGVHTQVWLFQPARCSLHAEPPPLTFKSSLGDAGSYGPVPPPEQAVEYFDVHDTVVYSLGKFLAVFQGAEHAICVEKRLVQFAASTVVGNARDQMNFQTIVSRTKSQAEKWQIRDARAVFTAAVFGFTVNASFEHGVMQEVIKPNLGLFGAHTNALQFKFNWLIKPHNLAVASAVGGLLGVTMLRMGHTRMVPTIFPKAAFGCAIALGLTSLLQTWWQKVDLREQVRRGFNAFSTHFESFTTPVLKAVSFPSLSVARYTSQRELLESREEATMAVPTFPALPRRSIVPRTHLYGVGATTSIPVVPDSNLENEIVAVANRGVQKVPPMSKVTWALFEKWVLKWFDELYPGWADFEPNVSFSEWNDRFPAGRRKENLRAREYLLKFPKSIKSLNLKRKSFVKVEKIFGKSGVGKFEEFDPRLIQGATSEVNVTVGPEIYALSKWLAKSWDVRNQICYSSGLTAQAIGKWFHDSLNVSHPSADSTTDTDALFILEDDASRWDSTLREEAMKFEVKIKRMFLSRSVCDIIEAQCITEGWTKFGVHYTVRGTRKSGDNNTSEGNSELDGLFHLYSFACCEAVHTNRHVLNVGPRDVKSHMIVLGDDNLSFVPRSVMENLALVEQTLRELGINPKLKLRLNPNEAEFCSSRFWPCTVGGESTRVLGPKIGRMLGRLGWATQKQEKPAEWLRGVMLGVIEDVNFIPFLREVVHLSLHLTKNVKSKRITDDHRVHCTVAAVSNPETWRMLADVYDVSDIHYQEWIALLGNITSLPTAVSGPLVQKFTEADET
jgi:hypothetical protein